MAGWAGGQLIFQLYPAAELSIAGSGATLVTVTRQVELLTRDGCALCARLYARLVELSTELGFALAATDVDAAAESGEPGLRAEYGDRLPVVLLDGREHSYWELDEDRLRTDLRT